MSKTPKGYTCKCGKFHPFSLWVYAHMDITITHTCDKCKKKNTLLGGKLQ